MVRPRQVHNYELTLARDCHPGRDADAAVRANRKLLVVVAAAAAAGGEHLAGNTCSCGLVLSNDRLSKNISKRS